MEKSKVLKLMLILATVVALTIADFLILGEGIVMAINAELENQNMSTSAKNVEFDAYFNNGTNKTHSTIVQMGEEPTLIIEVKVKEKGSFNDGKIKIENANFKILKDKVDNSYVKSINEDTNEIELNSIVYENIATIELPIQFKKENQFNMDYLERENTINLSGVYKDEKEQGVEGSKKTQIYWTSEADVTLSQDLEKYKILEEKVILQQNVTTEVTNNELPRESETLNVQAPKLGEKAPETVVVLLNGRKLENQKVTYDLETGKIEVKNISVTNEGKATWGEGRNEYKFIYTYNKNTASTENAEVVENFENANSAELATEIKTTLFTREEITKQETKSVEITEKGNLVSIERNVTEELNKGYLYAEASNETIFKERNTLEISETETIENIEITKGTENFVNEQEKTFDISNNILYRATAISKEDFTRIFGVDGEILIKDLSDKVLNVINKDTTVDENGNIVIVYNEEINDIKITTSKPVSEGKIDINHTRAIKGQTGYSKNQLKTFNKLVTSAKVLANQAEEIAQAETKLNDTKTEAKLEMSNNVINTLETNENIQFIATLKSNSAEYDLFKNPTVSIVLPKELNVNVTNITPLNGQDELTIVEPKSYTNDEGETVIDLALQGEQRTFGNSANEGIKVAITANIDTEKSVPTKDAVVKMNYTNENRSGETFTYELPVKINSKYGALLVSKLSGYNAKEEVVETIDDKAKIATLDIQGEEKVAKHEITFTNNYETAVTDLVFVAKIPSIANNEISDISLIADSINVEGKEFTVYYSEDVNATKDSDTWSENVEDITKVRAFKIVLTDNQIDVGQVVKATYNLKIPAELQPNEKVESKVVASYVNDGNPYDVETTIILQTGEEDVSKPEDPADGSNPEDPSDGSDGTGEENPEGPSDGSDGAEEGNPEEPSDGVEEETEDMTIKVEARSGGKTLKAGDTVYEGQGIKYVIKVTNNSNEAINNVKLEAVNENSIYYNLIEYQDDINGQIMTLHKIDEDESLTSKILNIEIIEAGETKEVDYQISVKDNLTDEQIQKGTAGTIKITADGKEEKTIDNIDNKIEKAKIKATLRYGFPEEIDTYSGSGFPIEMNVKNISNEATEEVIVELPVPEQVVFRTDRVDTTNKEYEFVEYKNNVVKFKIHKLDPGKDTTIYMQLVADEISIEQIESKVTQYFIANYENKIYNSNEIEKVIYQSETTIVAKLTTYVGERIAKDGDKIKDGDNIKYVIDIQNTGSITSDISIIDIVPTGLKINGTKKVLGDIEEDISMSANTLVDGETLKPKENIQYIIDTTLQVDQVGKNKEISNYAEISGLNIYEKTETIVLEIEKEEDPNVPVDPENPDEPNNPDKPGEPEEPNNPEVETTYSISGTAWVDNNQNGMRETTETVMPNIPIILIDEATGEIAKNKKNENVQTVTNSRGNYKLSNLKKGKYIVVFKYDNNKYAVAEYQKEGISEVNNSDIVSDKMNINGKELVVAATKTLEINSGDITNIDAGFVEAKNFDLSLNKYISKIIVQNNKGTRALSYNKEKLAKFEIDAKDLNSSNIIIEYNIEVTNEGETAGYANEIVDYMPKDLTFSSDMNKSWYQNTKGEICTKELSNTIINPGESKNVKLTLTKKMTQDSTGTVINSAEINSANNYYMINDIDSSAGNRAEKEDDYSKAEIIISVRTGKVVMYISLVITLIAIIGTGIYFIDKKVIIRN